MSYQPPGTFYNIFGIESPWCAKFCLLLTAYHIFIDDHFFGHNQSNKALDNSSSDNHLLVVYIMRFICFVE